MGWNFYVRFLTIGLIAASTSGRWAMAQPTPHNFSPSVVMLSQTLMLPFVSSLEARRQPRVRSIRRLADLLRDQQRRPDVLEIGTYSLDEIDAAGAQLFGAHMSGRFRSSSTMHGLQNMLPLIERIVEFFEWNFKNRILLICGRDAETIYDALRTAWHGTADQKRVYLFPGSSILWDRAFGTYPRFVRRRFFAAFGITRRALLAGQQFIILDSGFQGTIALNVQSEIARLFGLPFEFVQRAIPGYLVQAEESAFAQLLFPFEGVPSPGVFLMLAGRISLLGFTINAALATVLQLLPRHHHSYRRIRWLDGGFRAVPEPRAAQHFMDDIDHFDDLNDARRVHPLASMIAQHDVYTYFAQRAFRRSV